MAEDFGEKTEAPTPKRKRDSAKEGNILKSREFATALVVLAGCGWMALFGGSLLDACKALMAASFQFGRGDVEDFEPFRALAEAGWKLVPSLGILFAVTVLAGITSQAGLGAFQFNPGLWAPKASRVNPLAGLKRMLGPQGWIELGKSLLKVALLAAIGAYMLNAAGDRSIGMASTDINRAVASLGSTLVGIMFAMAAGLALIAAIDVPIQIVRLLGKLRMSKQEVKDEHKESEGSPEAKGAMRARQRQMAKRSVKQAVAGAHVVLTNPTHFSVALRYERATDQVPVVVAKGRGITAFAIREVATELGVPVLEYPALARALYYTSQENQEIRDDLYMAIATVLAFVFNLNLQAGGTPPAVTVPPGARFDENGVKVG
ncbi:flagellar biosynthesis protein FlhB [Hephaestia sp. GCM10023244]|uniref:EscU/YscU/HrcU family type III secretion system export apparatus switch protein n=1 Tax=unclassified Hephaestia TaxID=2631281 RepID=UPI0020774772|nr:flagellar type III secretion system protein FlhB [Hephaestia sp. MAHUQ-44]MCM8731273.1 flagellar type III secretion system protein FlhB [Hephaestia sp. MAHUQ-44]